MNDIQVHYFVFEIKISELSKNYCFELIFGRCKSLFSSKPSDRFAVYLMNCNQEALKIKCDLYIVSEPKTQCYRSTMRTEFGPSYLLTCVWGYSNFISVKQLVKHASLFLPEGCLTFKCEITIYNPPSIFKSIIKKKSGTINTTQPFYTGKILFTNIGKTK